jgi:hypothetical protein
MSPRNAWALLLDSSGDDVPAWLDPHARWRISQKLAQHPLGELDSRLDERASVHRLWALPGELRPLREDHTLVLSGSSAAGALKLNLAAPDAIDAYVPAGELDRLVAEYGLNESPGSRANVILRAVPDDAWCLGDRRVAPPAAVGFDLARYPDSRSARVGRELLGRLDEARVRR